MTTYIKEHIEKLSPAQQEALGHLEGQRISRRLALLKQTRPSRCGFLLLLTLMVGLTVTFVGFPSSRPWVLLVGVVALGSLIAGLNQRLDALAELLERDLKRAANDEESYDDRAP